MYFGLLNLLKPLNRISRLVMLGPTPDGVPRHEGPVESLFHCMHVGNVNKIGMLFCFW